MALHGVGDVEQSLGGELAAPEYIGAHGACYQQSGRGAKATADGNVGINVDLNAPDLLAHGAQHRAVGGIGQVVRAGVGLVAAGDLQPRVGFLEGYIGVQVEGAAEGVKARAQIGGGGGDADGNTIHGASPYRLST